VLCLAFSESEQDKNLNRPLDMNGHGVGQNNQGIDGSFYGWIGFCLFGYRTGLGMEWRSVKKNEKKKDKEGGPDAENSAVSEEAQANSQD
jgi:hypothetical protein